MVLGIQLVEGRLDDDVREAPRIMSRFISRNPVMIARIVIRAATPTRIPTTPMRFVRRAIR